MTMVVLASDEEAGAILDAEGRIIWIDLKAVRKAIDGTYQQALPKLIMKS